MRTTIILKIVALGALVIFAVFFVIKQLNNKNTFTNKTLLKNKNKVKNYYSHWAEEEIRLFKKPAGIIERLRTESLLKRYLPKAPAVIYDVGGGAGVYAFPLTKQGYRVHLIDFTPLHIEQAKKRMVETGIQLASASVGDARKLKVKDGTADVVLYLGPLYHLQKKEDREKALQEAYRILKPGGILFAAGISRFAVILKFSAKKKQVVKKKMASLLEKGLKTGKYDIPVVNRGSFSMYGHLPDELEKELLDANFKNTNLFGIEGPSWMFATLEEIVKNKKALNALLHFLEELENEPSLIGASSHIMAIGRK